jgi:hypothetical protein
LEGAGLGDEEVVPHLRRQSFLYMCAAELFDEVANRARRPGSIRVGPGVREDVADVDLPDVAAIRVREQLLSSGDPLK